MVSDFLTGLIFERWARKTGTGGQIMGGNQLFSYGWLVVMNGRGALGQEMLGLGARTARLEPKALISPWRRAGGQGLPLPIAETELGIDSRPVPPDASGACRPSPQAPTKFVRGHP